MLFLILGIVVGLAIVGGMLALKKRIDLGAIIGGVVVAGIITCLGFIAIIPANTVGVVYSPFAGVQEKTLSEGWHSKGLFDQIHKISTQVQTATLSEVVGQTKDSQYVTMVIDVKYRVDSSKAFEVFRSYQTLGNVASTLIRPLVQRSIEAVTTQYNVMEVLGESRNEMYKKIEVEMQDRLANNGITFVSLNFDDMDAGEAIEKAITEEAIAKKAVETAEQLRLKAEVEAQKRVVEAQADLDKAKIEAEAKLIAAEAEAKANKLLSESISDKLLKKMEMEARLKHGWVTIQGGTVITDATQD